MPFCKDSPSKPLSHPSLWWRLPPVHYRAWCRQPEDRWSQIRSRVPIIVTMWQPLAGGTGRPKEARAPFPNKLCFGCLGLGCTLPSVEWMGAPAFDRALKGLHARDDPFVHVRRSFRPAEVSGPLHSWMILGTTFFCFCADPRSAFVSTY